MIGNFFTRVDAPIKILLLAGLVALGILQFSDRNKEVRVVTDDGEKVIENVQLIDTCQTECESKIRELVSEAIATLSAKVASTPVATPKPTVSPTVKPLSLQQQVFYVPVGSSGSTTKTDWADLLNTDFFFDIGEYGKVKETRWSANIKIFQNGEAFARLFDVTHSVAVPGSEMITKNTNYTLIEKGPIIFLSGKNVYRVQMKSLTGYEASFDSGRVKITSE